MNDLTLAEIKILLESLIIAAERGVLDGKRQRMYNTENLPLIESEADTDVLGRVNIYRV
jgi:hypothetical protein